ILKLSRLSHNMEQTRVADLNRIVGEITNFGRTTSTHKPSTTPHSKDTEDAEPVYAAQDDQYHWSRTTPQDENQEIQTLTGDTNQPKASPTLANRIPIPSYQQRINFISRPKSANSDLSPGFTFGKAQPLKPLTFNRRQGQTLPERVFGEKSTDSSTDRCQVTTEGNHVPENIDDPSPQPHDQDVSPGSTQSTLLAERNTKMTHGDHSDDMNAPQLSSRDSPASHNPSLRVAPTPNGQTLSNVSEYARKTLLETAIVSHDGQDTFVSGEMTLPPDVFPHQPFDTLTNRVNDKDSLANDQRTAAPSPPQKVTETVCRSPKSLQATSSNASESKTRSRPVQIPGPVASEPLVHLHSSRLLTDEQLIDIFISRYRDQYQASMQAKAKEAKQSEEIQDLTGVCYELHNRLDKAQLEVIDKEKELLKYDEQVPRWQ
ncbi:MAG: hypothetical protein Q9214_007421, partial [Letrouitia sp. 1 TL-2023]